MIMVISEYKSKRDAPGIREMCATLGIPRSTYYRYMKHDWVDEDYDANIRKEIYRIALEMPSYGYRRIAAELKRRGYSVNHKRTMRLMREENLLCVRKKRFIRTTDSDHGLPVYPNLLRDAEITGINRAWVADITYIRLKREFVYLAVLMDAYSRRCIGWSIGRRLTTGLTVEALRKAFSSRDVKPGLIHHSDRGVQYASREYTGLLKKWDIRISMSRTGNPYDNAKAERFIKTLKYEEIHLTEYDDLEDARRSISKFISEVYNENRLHSALGYLPPAEFEDLLITKNPTVPP